MISIASNRNTCQKKKTRTLSSSAVADNFIYFRISYQKHKYLGPSMAILEFYCLNNNTLVKANFIYPCESLSNNLFFSPKRL